MSPYHARQGGRDNIMESTKVFVGIDVSTESLDVSLRPEGKSMSLDNTAEGIKKLCKILKKASPELIVFEATGGLEVQAATTLALKNLPVVVANPRQVRAFAKATGKLAKTDAIDAEVIAHFAEAVRPEVRPLKDKNEQELSALIARRTQVVDMMVAEKNRSKRTNSKRVLKELKEHIAWLERRLKNTDKDIESAIKESPVWRVKDDLLRSVPGVGKVLSTSLMAKLPELGKLDRRAVAALVGVAPLNRDSGLFKGSRSVWGGRADVRTALYMATMSAIRYNPVISAFYERLKERGKKFKVAVTACMRKLIVILNAMLKNNEPWNYEIA